MARHPGWSGQTLLWTLILGWGVSCAAPQLRTDTQARFVFQSSFWVNLHHFLRAEVRRHVRGAELVLSLETLPACERAAWSAGLEAYRDLSQRNLLFDDELVAIKVALAGLGNTDSLPAGLISADLCAALNRAAPVYRARVWPEQRLRNEQWIAETEGLVDRHAAALTGALAAAYRVPWPALPILVDPCSESGPFLAYTTNTAPAGFAGHIVIAPSDSNRGPVALECVAHEASHVVDEALTRQIDEESARQGLESPPELWHALLFFTSGVITERILGAAGTYWTDVTEGYPAYADALEQHWRPYLEHAAPFEEALIKLVRDASTASEGAAGR